MPQLTCVMHLSRARKVFERFVKLLKELGSISHDAEFQRNQKKLIYVCVVYNARRPMFIVMDISGWMPPRSPLRYTFVAAVVHIYSACATARIHLHIYIYIANLPQPERHLQGSGYFQAPRIIQGARSDRGIVWGRKSGPHRPKMV